MAELAEDKCDLVTEKRRRVVHAAGESVDGRDGGRKVGRRSKIAERKHGPVALEQREGCVEEGLFEFRDGRSLSGLRERRRRVDICEVTVS